MKYYLFACISILIIRQSTAQDKLVFEQYKFDSSFAILGACSYNENGKVHFKDYSFYINDTAGLNKLKASLKYGKRLEMPVLEDDDFAIYIIKNKAALDTDIFINPTYSIICIDGWFYEFDVSQLKKLHDIYPVNFSFKLSRTKSDTETDKLISNMTTKGSLLCYQDISEEMSGSATLLIPRNKECTSGPQGIKIIKEKLLALGIKESDFLIGYIPVLEETAFFKLELHSSKEVYNRFSDSGYQLSAWKVKEAEILSYWRK